MKKIFPVIILFAAAGLLYWLKPSPETATQTSKKTADSADSSKASLKTPAGTTGSTGIESDEIEGTEDEDNQWEDIKPATELYTNAEQALKAVEDGASEYDDLILEQFVDPDPACNWCPEFYASINEKMLDSDISADEKSYYAEILAISGRVDNIASLVNVIQGSSNEDDKDVYAEALEVTVGDDSVVQYLGDQLNTSDELLKESTIAAITNHGSKLAIDLLYKQTIEKGDPDGFYSLGIGLGEVIPDDDTLPYLQELASKRDEYSHLAVKALLNQGDDGLRRVMTLLENSENSDFDRQMLEDAVDHVAFEDETEAYLERMAENGKTEISREFAKDILSDFEDLDEEETLDFEELEENEAAE